VLVANPGAEIWLTGTVAVKGERRTFRIRVDRRPELLAAIARLHGRTQVDWRELDVSLETKLALTALGLVVKPEEVVCVPHFRCGEAELASELVPELVDAAADDELAPDALFARDGCARGVLLPPGAAERLDLAGETVWVADGRAGIRLPCAVPDGTIAAIEAGDALPPATWRLLRNAGATKLAPRRSRPLSSAASLDALRAELDDQGTVVLRDLLPPLATGALRRYLRALHDGGVLEHHVDPAFPQRWIAHNEPVVRMLHEPLVRVVSELSRTAVKASYCFLARYGTGARMPRHTDREQCAWNMSFVLDADPAPREADAWPLLVEERGRVRAARLCIGDAVLYKGTASPHWRDQLDAGNYIIAFFHFVDESFTGSLD
jgi:hypothetical protein